MFQRSNVEFCQAKSQNKSASEREKKLKDLAAAYDSFMELRANLQEGTKVSHALRSERRTFDTRDRFLVMFSLPGSDESR